MTLQSEALTAVKSDPLPAGVASLERSNRGVQPLSRGAAKGGLPRQRPHLALVHRAQGPAVNVSLDDSPVQVLGRGLRGAKRANR